VVGTSMDLKDVIIALATWSPPPQPPPPPAGLAISLPPVPQQTILTYVDPDGNLTTVSLVVPVQAQGGTFDSTILVLPPPQPGTYTETCTETAFPLTCCYGGQCLTTPGFTAIVLSANFTLASGTSVSQLLSEQCSAWAESGCSNTCSFVSSGTSFATIESCTSSSTGCTDYTVTITCSQTLQ